ncbi:unnamed protein product [Allacma fusca]|uniref:tRNA (guanine(37)-N1)-methyltransferase n=1 Tax=Allacma fusca TaxID=39272 RepID=A0A8J2KPE6_9HEXA|nr:unnamed protein product [Allacma fusca]
MTGFSRTRDILLREVLGRIQNKLQEVGRLQPGVQKRTIISSAMEKDKGRDRRQKTKELILDSTKHVANVVTPPVCKGMTTLLRSAFDKNFEIPTVTLGSENWSTAFTILKPYLLKIRNLKPVRVSEDGKTKYVYLNPALLKGTSADEFLELLRSQSDTGEVFQSISVESVCFSYDNWSHDQVLDSVLPDDIEKLSSYSKVGHLIHLNLRDHLLPYKDIIGQILLDKIPSTKTVVNKLNTIDNTFRNFQMEVIAGENDTVVTVKHAKCEFQFDFAHVYWNPRLGTEHERIHCLLERGDVLYDVFAGVGPFAVPAGKQKVQVLANDLNPKSFEWLQLNIKKNKVSDYVKAYNLDGRDFITTVVQQDLVARLESGQISQPFHVVMNLPAIAVEFLDAFWNILHGKEVDDLNILVHVYCFVKGAENYKKEALELVKDQLGFQLEEDEVNEVAFVRNVAPNKEMLRVSFKLPKIVLTSPKPVNDGPSPKKRKVSEVTEDESSV